jgi:prepilin-type N-terminal cleavage/methylation domain-containing protein
MKKFQKGFTLIEILVVIGILAILFTIALVAINPGRQFQQANDTKRRSDVNTVLNAITQYAADNAGNLPMDISTTPQTVSAAGANICTDLVTRYLAGLPSDPTAPGGSGDITDCDTVGYNTEYEVYYTGDDHRVTVSAPRTQLAPSDITVTR